MSTNREELIFCPAPLAQLSDFAMRHNFDTRAAWETTPALIVPVSQLLALPQPNFGLPVPVPA